MDCSESCMCVYVPVCICVSFPGKEGGGKGISCYWAAHLAQEEAFAGFHFREGCEQRSLLFLHAFETHSHLLHTLDAVPAHLPPRVPAPQNSVNSTIVTGSLYRCRCYPATRYNAIDRTAQGLGSVSAALVEETYLHPQVDRSQKKIWHIETSRHRP